MSYSPLRSFLSRLQPAPGSRAIVGWAIALFAVALSPLIIFKYPGLQDYPNHLARAFILLNQEDSILARSYEIRWMLLPNLGWDIWAMAVGRLLSIEWTGRLFLMISGAAILSGCFALNRTLTSRFSYAPLLAVPFLFNSGFSKGFLSFELAAGGALLAAAWWVSAKDMYWPRRLLIATVCSTILYLIHFYGWAFYGLFVFGYEVQRMIRAGRTFPSILSQLCRDGLQAIPALAMFVFANFNSTPPELVIRKFDVPHVRIAEIQSLIDVGNPFINFVLVLVMLILIGVMIWRGLLQVRSDFALPIGLSIALFFLIPDQISGTYYVAWRLIFMALLVFIASCVPTRRSVVSVNPFLGVTALVTVVAAGITIWSWHNAMVGREAFLKIIQRVPEGSALFVIHNGMKPQRLVREAVGLYHVGSFAVLTRRALVQSMFALPGQQPLQFRDASLQSAPHNTATFLSDVRRQFRKEGLDFRSHLLKFDYVVLHGPDYGDDLEVLSRAPLNLIEKAVDFRLYEIAREDPSAAEHSGLHDPAVKLKTVPRRSRLD